MRREIVGIFLFFFVIFTLISLLSYSPADPSIHSAGTGGRVHNLFGFVGAHLAGFLIGLFGLGAFWIPILFLIISMHFFGNHPGRVMLSTLAGGILLILTTGSLLAVHQDYYVLFDKKFSTGGMLGIPLKGFLVRYTNPTGGLIVLTLLWLVGFILATGFSLLAFLKRGGGWFGAAHDSLTTVYLKSKERRVRAKRLAQAEPEKTVARVKEIKIQAAAPKPAKVVPPPKQEVFDFMQAGKRFQLPPFSLLEDPEAKPASLDSESLRMQSKLLEKKLEDFGVNGKVVAVSPGPVITTFEYEPAPGVKINKIASLSDDLALALRATSIRIVAPIPGKAVIGIELPNAVREVVRFKEIVVTSAFEKSKSRLTICLGKDIVGNPVVAELDKMPHLLIAGATGSGQERDPQHDDLQHPLQGAPGGGEVHHGRPQAHRTVDLRRHTAPDHAGGDQPQEGHQRAVLGGAGNGGALRAARREEGPQHRAVQPEDGRPRNRPPGRAPRNCPSS